MGRREKDHGQFIWMVAASLLGTLLLLANVRDLVEVPGWIADQVARASRGLPEEDLDGIGFCVAGIPYIGWWFAWQYKADHTVVVPLAVATIAALYVGGLFVSQDPVRGSPAATVPAQSGTERLIERIAPSIRPTCQGRSADAALGQTARVACEPRAGADALFIVEFSSSDGARAAWQRSKANLDTPAYSRQYMHGPEEWKREDGTVSGMYAVYMSEGIAYLEYSDLPARLFVRAVRSDGGWGALHQLWLQGLFVSQRSQ